MPRLAFKNCKGCGRSSATAGPLSWTRLCVDCSHERFEANLDQLRAHEGEFFQHHRRRCVAAFGGVLLDDTRESA